MTPAALTLLILAGAIGLFAWNRFPVGVVAVLTALALYLTGILEAEAVVAGFGDPVVIFIATLFIVSEGLDATGVTTWAGQQLTRTGRRPAILLAALMLLTGVLAALITPNGAAAALLPVAIALARRARQSPSRTLIPFAYAASAGSLLALSGSPVNIIVSDASRAAGGPGFGYFQFAIVGVPLVAATLLVALTLGRRLLPQRLSPAVSADFSGHADLLIEHYRLDHGFYRLRRRDHRPPPSAGWNRKQLSAYPDVTLIGVQNSAGHAISANHPIHIDDVVVLAGPAPTVRELANDTGLNLTAVRLHRDSLLNRHLGVAEVVIPPRSPLVGQTVFPGMMRRGRLLILGVRHLGSNRGPRPTQLAEGDTLLLRGPWQALDALADERSILVVDSPELLRRQTIPLGQRSGRAIGILAGMVILLATGITTPAIAGLTAAAAMVALRVVTAHQAYRAVSWQTVVLIGGLIPLSTAIQTSGAAATIADIIADLVGQHHPYILMITLFLLTAALGQIISNTATVLILVPIATTAALDAAVSPQPILMLIAVAGAASFLTPIATPANMIVMGPGGYRFGDYWRLGLVTMGLWLLIALITIPIAWPL